MITLRDGGKYNAERLGDGWCVRWVAPDGTPSEAVAARCDYAWQAGRVMVGLIATDGFQLFLTGEENFKLMRENIGKLEADFDARAKVNTP